MIFAALSLFRPQATNFLHHLPRDLSIPILE
jgi:hypothetical protein